MFVKVYHFDTNEVIEINNSCDLHTYHLKTNGN